MTLTQTDRLHTAHTTLQRDRARGLSLLNHLFRTGTPPRPPVHGRLAGELVALNLAPGLTQLLNAVVSAWLPWKGKTFDWQANAGDNIFTRDSLFVARLFNPAYSGFVEDSPQTYRAFQFRTYVAPGLADTDCTVLKIDYNLPENPALTIRRVLDELVQIDDGVYLGKAHVQWWWGTWQLVAYFVLRTI